MICEVCKLEKDKFLEDRGIMHECPPAYDIRRGDGNRDTWNRIYSDDIEYAVDVYVDEHFSDWEYPQSGFTVEVKPADCEGPITVYEIEVESIPTFLVSEKATYVDQAALEAES